VKHIALNIAGVAAAALIGSSARAEMSICNDFQAPIHVAFAYESDGRYTAQGWWRVEPNACQPSDFAYQGTTLYYTADSNNYREGRATKHDHWGNKVKLFVAKKDFKADDAQKSRRGASPAMFSSVALSTPPAGKTLSVTFHFKSGGTTIVTKPVP
jgi:uncharacterized membrane protein